MNMSFFVSSFSKSSIFPGNRSRKALTASWNPRGRSSRNPPDERNHLLPLLLLRRLLDARVQVANRRHARLDRLAIELQHETQYAVRTGVLRPHVDGHRFRAQFSHRLVRPLLAIARDVCL